MAVSILVAVTMISSWMIALFFFGRAVEHEFGWKKALLIFLGCGIIGNIAVLAGSLIGIMPFSIPTIGASGAIFGMMGVAMITRPFELILYPYLIPVPLVLVAVLYTMYNIFDFVYILFSGGETDVAYMAHIGGLIGGAFVGFRREGAKRGVLTILLIFILLLIIPLILGYLESFNYIVAFSEIFK